MQIAQGNLAAKSDEAVLWIDRAEAFSGQPSKVIAYVEGNVSINFGKGGDPYAVAGRRSQTMKARTWLGRFHTTGGIELAAPVSGGEAAVRPAIFDRGLAARESEGSGAGLGAVPIVVQMGGDAAHSGFAFHLTSTEGIHHD